MRKKIVAANWKMNMLQAEAAEFVKDLLLEIGDMSAVEVVIVPPFTAIAIVVESLGKAQNIKVGAQNMFWETDEIVNRKVRAALEATLRPIVCVGETLEQREKGSVEKILSLQLRGSLAGLKRKDFQEIVVAYEPVWAIGTGRNASPQQAQEAHAFIREILGKLSDA